MSYTFKYERAEAGHKRRWGGKNFVTREVRKNVIRVTDASSSAWSEWDASAWRVRCIDYKEGGAK